MKKINISEELIRAESKHFDLVSQALEKKAASISDIRYEKLRFVLDFLRVKSAEELEGVKVKYFENQFLLSFNRRFSCGNKRLPNYISSKTFKELEEYYEEYSERENNIEFLKSLEIQDLKIINNGVIKRIDLELLVTAKPDEIRLIIQEFQNKNVEVKKFKLLKEIYTETFSSYDKDATDNSWNAINYIKLLNLEVCPYCNSNFLSTIYSEKQLDDLIEKASSNEEVITYINDDIKNEATEKIFPTARIRAELDHAYPQNKYPYLAMTLYNLIPSCSTCNSKTIKHTTEFVEGLFLHPFEHSLDDYVYFKIDDETSGDLVNSLLDKNYELKITYEPKIEALRSSDSIKNILKSMYMLEFFYILERVNSCNNTIKEIIQLNVLYPDNYLNEVSKVYGLDVETKVDSLIDFTEKFEKRIFGKVYKDILNEIKNGQQTKMTN